jgi:hypothetical protein
VTPFGVKGRGGRSASRAGVGERQGVGTARRTLVLAQPPTPRRGSRLDQLAAEIRREYTAAQEDFESAVMHAVRCGEKLIEAKADVGWGNWCS